MSELSSSRFSRLETGGVIRITEAIMKGSGPQGPVGPKGDMGPATHILGTLPNYDEINATPSPVLGDAWIARDTGKIWVYSDTVRDIPTSQGVVRLVKGWNDGGRIVGNPGYLQSLAAKLTSTAQIAVPETDAEVVIPLAKVDFNDKESVLNEDGSITVVPIVVDPTAFPFSKWSVGNANTMGYLFTVKVRINTSAATRGRVTLNLRTDTGIIDTANIAADGLSAVIQDIQVISVVKANSTMKFWITVNSPVGLKVVDAEVYIARYGGGIGPQGNIGPQGAAAYAGLPVTAESDLPRPGNPGEMRLVTSTGCLWVWNSTGLTPGWVNAGKIQGPNGNASSGFSDFDDLTAQTSSEDPPSAGGPVPGTADQGIPYPTGKHSPVVPYFLKSAFQFIERRLVARYVSWGDWGSKRPVSGTNARVNGETVWVDNEGSRAGGLLVWDTQLGGDSIGRVPFVGWNQGTPPAVGSPTTFPDGSLWVSY